MIYNGKLVRISQVVLGCMANYQVLEQLPVSTILISSCIYIPHFQRWCSTIKFRYKNALNIDASIKGGLILMKKPFKITNSSECFHKIYYIVLVLFPHLNRFFLELWNSSGQKKLSSASCLNVFPIATTFSAPLDGKKRKKKAYRFISRFTDPTDSISLNK